MVHRPARAAFAEGTPVVDVPGYGIMPLVESKRVEMGYEVRCPYCAGQHTHGVGVGSRLAHCEAKGAGDHEYYLRPAGHGDLVLPWGKCDLALD